MEDARHGFLNRGSAAPGSQEGNGDHGDRDSDWWDELAGCEIARRNEAHAADFGRRVVAGKPPLRDQDGGRLGPLIWALIAIVVIVASVFWMMRPAPATWSPQLAAEWGETFPDGIPDNVRSWFKAVRSPHGVPCCDIADGHRTAYDIRPQGPGESGYWVPIENEWRPVPADAVVHNAGNPVGEAVVWYVRQGAGTFYIRCFVPGGGV